MTRPTNATISLQALAHNLQRVKEFSKNAGIVSMVKANAYGHGLQECVRALSKTDRFGVCCLEEALQVSSVCQHDVMLMEGFFKADELPIIAKHDFIITIHTLAQIDVLEQFQSNHLFRVCLKINTGMNRLGIAPKDVRQAMQRLSACSIVAKPLTVMTHCANADDKQDQTTQIQADLFYELTNEFSLETSVANSAVIMGWPDIPGDWVRPGLMLYGISPFAGTAGIDFDLKPVMMVRSEIIALRECQKGERVGYGGTYTCDKPTIVGVVAIGYGDGYPRHAPTGTPVLVDQTIVPLIGRVSMDMITVDCSSLKNVEIGSPVVLWGEGLPVEIIAEKSGTIAYELVCGVTPRVSRSYVDTLAM